MLDISEIPGKSFSWSLDIPRKVELVGEAAWSILAWLLALRGLEWQEEGLGSAAWLAQQGK